MRSLTFIFSFLVLCGLSTAQTVTTFAGKDNSADPTVNFNNIGSTPDESYFYEPQGIAWDQTGHMYVTERNKIRCLINGKFENRSGKLGNGSFSHGYKDGAGIAGEYFAPSAIVSDASGNMYIVDSENHAIRKLVAYTSLGQPQSLSTFAGAAPPTATSAHKDATGLNARFNTPKGIVKDKNGNFYISDYNNMCIRKITSGGVVTTLSGQPGVEGSADGSNGTNSTYGGPWGMAMLNDNEIIITDQFNGCIRKVNISSGQTTTISGKVGEQYFKDGTLSAARFKNPQGITVADGLIYVCDDAVIRIIDIAKNTVSTFAGSQSAQGNTNGIGGAARFGRLSGIAYDGTNALYVTDVYYHQIRKVTIDNLAPSCDFTATKVSLKVNEETTLSNTSGGKTATSGKWEVTAQAGGTANVVLVSGNLNSSANITVKFSAVGFYTVKLDVTNEFGSDSKTKNSFLSVSTTGGLFELGEIENNLLVYPNPAQDKVVVNGGNFTLSNATLLLKDITGREMAILHNASGTTIMDVSDIPSGLYLLQVMQDGNILQRKIQVQ